MDIGKIWLAVWWAVMMCWMAYIYDDKITLWFIMYSVIQFIGNDDDDE